MGLNFDTLVERGGFRRDLSGYIRSSALSAGKRIVGLNVCDTAEQFRQEITEILEL